MNPSKLRRDGRTSYERRRGLVFWADQELKMTEQVVSNQIVQRWYTRPVLFVADVKRALHFYIDMLGCEERWHEGDGAGKVWQVNLGLRRGPGRRPRRE